MAVAGMGMLLTCGTGTGTGNAALLDPHDFTSLGTADFTADATYDVSGAQPRLGSFTGVYSGGTAVFTFDSFSLGPGATISQFGSGGPPIAILSRGDISIAGTIDVSAKPYFRGTPGPGPGGNPGGAGGTPGTETRLGGAGAKGGGTGGGGGGGTTVRDHPTDPVSYIGGWGGGGGGFGGDGTIGDGGEGGGPSSAGGPEVPGRLIDNLVGGSGGGGGGGGFAGGPLPGGTGGGGGGALAVVAEGLLELAAGGRIAATGARGEGAFVEGAGGGGSGGGVLLYGDVVDFDGGISVEGGGDGGGAFGFFAGAGGGGKIEIYYGTGFTQTGFVNISGGLTANAGAYRGGDGIYLVEQLSRQPTEVPVSNSLALLGAALGGFALLRVRRLLSGGSLVAVLATLFVGAGAARAAVLDPRDFASIGPGIISGDVEIEVTGSNPTLRTTFGQNLLYTGVYSNGLAVFSFDDLSVASGAELRGPSPGIPVAFLARGDVNIAGRINFNGSGGAGGAGGTAGVPGGAGGGPSPGQGGPNAGETLFGQGGGSGGFGGAGGHGGGPGGLAQGGPAVPGSLVDQLSGGSGGGGGSAYYHETGRILTGGAGGRGGGAVAIVALGLISLAAEGHISAGGTGGEIDPTPGGSGSGGGILLVANEVELFGHLNVSGGSGASAGKGSASGGGGGGKIEVVYDTRFVNGGTVNVAGGRAPGTMAEWTGEDGIFRATRRGQVAVREPGTLLIFGAGLLTLAWTVRRFSRG